MAEEEKRESAKRDFQAYGRPLETVTSFKYLGRVLKPGGDDWPSVGEILKRARKSWSRLTRILGRDGANTRVSGIFFKAVVQIVLLLGSTMWVLTPCMIQGLGFFRHRFMRRIIGRQPRR